MKSKRMVAIRQLRLQKAKADKKPSDIKPTFFDALSEKFIDTLLRRRIANEKCGHYLVGSSSFHSFLINGYTMKKAHLVFQTPSDNRVTGFAGEEAFLKNCSTVTFKYPFGIHRHVPWICCSGDFVIKENGEEILIEIKTSKSFERASALYENLDQRILLQVWTQMDVFGIDRCRLVFYYFDRLSKMIVLIGKIEVKKQIDLFTQKLALVSVVRYVDFLRDYFEHLKIYPSSEFLEKLKLRLANNVLSSLSQDSHQFKNPHFQYTKRSLTQDCQYLENQSAYQTGKNEEPFVPFATLFKHHRFNNRSKRTKTLVLDHEFRTDLLEKLLKKLNPVVLAQTNQLQSQVRKGLMKTDLITESRLRRIEKLSNQRKAKNELITMNSTQQLLARIEIQNRQIKKLQNQVKQLKQKPDSRENSGASNKSKKNGDIDSLFIDSRSGMKLTGKRFDQRSVSTRESRLISRQNTFIQSNNLNSKRSCRK